MVSTKQSDDVVMDRNAVAIDSDLEYYFNFFTFLDIFCRSRQTRLIP